MYSFLSTSFASFFFFFFFFQCEYCCFIFILWFFGFKFCSCINSFQNGFNKKFGFEEFLFKSTEFEMNLDSSLKVFQNFHCSIFVISFFSIKFLFVYFAVRRHYIDGFLPSVQHITLHPSNQPFNHLSIIIIYSFILIQYPTKKSDDYPRKKQSI